MAGRQPTDAIASDRQVYTIKEVCSVLGLKRSAAYDAVSRGEIPSVRIGQQIRVPVAAVQKLLAGAAR